MKRALLSFVVLVGSALYIFFQPQTEARMLNPDIMDQIPSSPSDSIFSTPVSEKRPDTYSPTVTDTQATPQPESSSSSTNSTSTKNTATQGQYRNGTYTGKTANAYYGWVQVETSIFDGKLASVEFLQYPNDRSTSRYINSQAMPLLKQEAIQAQSANVSGVSGATYTSRAFRASLADALTQAK